MIRDWRLVRLLAVEAFLFCAVLDLAAGGSLWLMELSAVAVAVVLLQYFWVECRFSLGTLLGRAKERLSLPGKALVLFGAVYGGLDLLSLLWSPSLTLALPKVPVVVLMAGVALALVLLAGQPGALGGCLGAMGLGAGVAALVAVVKAVTKWPPVIYTLRISLRVDYNMFAVALLLGWLGGFWLVAGRRRWRVGARGLLLFAGAVACLPAVLLSGSRRTVLLVWPVLALALAALALWWRREKKLLPAVALVVAVTMGVAATTLSLQKVLSGRGTVDEGLGAKVEVEGFPPSGETSLADRYGTIVDGSMLKKRLLIWQLAVRELATYSPAQWLAGKGAAYDIVLYDRLPPSQLAGAYYGGAGAGAMSAHNFVLADLLNGGLLRLVPGLAMVLCLGLCLLGWLAKGTPQGLLLTAALGVVVAGSLISNRYGLLYDKFFWIYGALAALRPGAGEEEAA